MHATCLTRNLPRAVPPGKRPLPVPLLLEMRQVPRRVAITDWLRLEVDTVSAGSADPVQVPGPNLQNRRARVLIADDDPDMRVYVRRCLAAAVPAFDEVHEAADGLAALQVLEKNDVDLIITDVVMPRMDGPALYAHLQAHERYADVAVLFVSAMLGESDLRSRLAPGPSLGYLPKPFSARTLLEAVARLR